MKTITYDEFITFEPCWLETPQGRRRLKYYAKKQKRWSALDILALKRVPAGDRLWAVLQAELIDTNILHEFICLCAEKALTYIKNPDSRSVEAIRIKKMWLNGMANNKTLDAARSAAGDAVRDATGAAARAAGAAVWATARDATGAAAWAAARAAVWAAAWAAAQAAGDAVWGVAGAAARAAEREWQANELIKLLGGNQA